MNISGSTLGKFVSIIVLLSAGIGFLTWQINLASKVKRLSEYRDLTEKKLELQGNYFRELEKKYETISSLDGRIRYIEDILDQYQLKNINQKISGISKIEQRLGDINTLSQRLRNVETLIQKIDNVEHLEQKIAILAKLDQRFSKVFNVDLDFEKLLDVHNRLSSIERKVYDMYDDRYGKDGYVRSLEQFIYSLQLDGEYLEENFPRDLARNIRYKLAIESIPEGSIICIKKCQ